MAFDSFKEFDKGGGCSFMIPYIQSGLTHKA